MCVLVGNVTRDPEVRFTQSGKAVASFGLAVNRRFQVNNEWQEETSFFDITAWGDLANNIVETVSKGTRLIVSGRLTQRTWQNDAGENRSKVEVVADDCGPSLRWARAEVVRQVNPDRVPAGVS